MPDSHETELARKAGRLKLLAEQLAAEDPEAAAACQTGADVLESLTEPLVFWND